MKNLLYLFAFSLIVSSCGKNEDFEFEDEKINLSNLKEGQKSIYYRYMTSCENLTKDFEYTGDTLIVEVISQNQNLYFKEYVTPNSPLYLNGSFVTEVIYPVKNVGQGVVMPERWNSALFFFYANDTLRLGMNPNVNLVQEKCKMFVNGDPFIGNDIGEISKFQIGPIIYRNLTVVSCEPLENLDAYLLHDDDQLYGSHM